jgi:dihydroxyacid dehydratase/phosphogluconate dehydratase
MDIANHRLPPVLDLGRIVKRSVEKQGMLAWQFNTVGVSDAITQGWPGMKIPSLVCHISGN